MIDADFVGVTFRNGSNPRPQKAINNLYWFFVLMSIVLMKFRYYRKRGNWTEYTETMINCEYSNVVNKLFVVFLTAKQKIKKKEYL